MGQKSETFTASNGVQQGGVISPLLFNVYLDVLLNLLKERGTEWIPYDLFAHYCTSFYGSQA